MKEVYSIPLNSDIILEFDIKYNGKRVPAYYIFDGMVNGETINDSILKPLMVSSMMEISDSSESLEGYIARQLLPHCQVKTVKGYSKIIDAINFGGCGVFADGLNVGFSADVKGWIIEELKGLTMK